MGLLNGVLTFIGSMHISAIIIISIILFIFFLSVIFIFLLRIKYGRLKRELDRQAAAGRSALLSLERNAAPSRRGARAPLERDDFPDIGEPQAMDRFSEPRFRSPILKGVVAEYEAAWRSLNGASQNGISQRGAEVNTQAVIENYFNTSAKGGSIQEGFTRHSVSVMIVIGLLGTFIGLTISVQSLVLLFRGYDVTELLSSVESGLLSALAGMSTAFTTSLFGIACSVIVTIINIFINPAQSRENLMIGIEEFLDNTVSARLGVVKNDEFELMNNALRSTFVEFGERIAERFDRTLVTMREDVRGIEEVNNNLRNTIEQMDVSFYRIADALKASTRHVDDNYQSLAALSARFKEMGEEFEESRREGVLHSENLVKSVSDAAAAINGLAGDLRGETQRRLDNFATYDAAIGQMLRSAELIRDAVAVIPEQMYAYTEANRITYGAASDNAAFEPYAGYGVTPDDVYGATSGFAPEDVYGPESGFTDASEGAAMQADADGYFPPEAGADGEGGWSRTE